MRRSLSWIDPEALSGALVRAGIRRTPRGGGGRGPNVELGRLQAGVAPSEGPLTLPRRPPPAAPPAPSDRAEPMAAKESRPPFRPPQGILETRLKAFFSWAIELTGSRSLFVTDGEGLEVMETGASSEMIGVTSSFTSLLDRIRSTLGSEPEGVVAIDLSPHRILHLIRIDSGLGAHTLGAVTSRPMPRDLVEDLRVALADLLAAEQVEELFGT